ncbi:MerR family DNA-binding transcriptional regulator [Plasticicumulans sp.]|uniref:MerR family transcriptional regulator n=1 Tax=Plasticicumulans sp. TaxID=2307179 RepID=UPI002B5D3AB2|nr:MerR family DNA-binding transcriptional regulator [Plasticicumulans sp.]HMV38657.1 MerR family DNA-binding transcriptional regulator [Plasticicumulans sp.]HMW28017.1 MerR family DNA-binding transcriptional regulator [Plasticicumulans sp.]HMW41057.1 MerR family DNA-binding transcriptional regulator [Plasticicumulans sp.]HMX53746.1 MerR family DNA-binding transcriptional regulator [Plasticicumulans sp.]HMZ09344.1 MerR family DNA-binding transcriptional regulator [Plasticicumulans sp.]
MNTGDKTAGTTYTISQLAREFDVTTRAIRFYEDQGLLIPERVGRRRIYARRDRTRLKLILRGKRLGMTLGETRELFDLFDSSRDEARQLERFLRILGERRDILVQQQRDIEAVLHEINAAAAECERLLAEHAEPSPQDPAGPTVPA